LSWLLETRSRAKLISVEIAQLSSSRPNKSLRWTHGPHGLVRAYTITPAAPMWPCVSSRSDELTFVLDGELTLAFGARAQSFTARAGDAFVVPRRSPHVVSIDRPVRLLVLDLLDGDRAPSPPPATSIALPRRLEAARVPRGLRRSLERAWSLPANVALPILAELRGQLGRQVWASPALPVEPAPSTPRVLRVKSLLENAVDAPPSLRVLAAGERVDPYYLIRAFKKNTGFTPKAYVQFLRVERFVWSLFEDPRQRSMLARSSDAGFDDYASFRRRIHDVFARAPSELLHHGGDRSLGP
jgi:mannose-6-phosphate isomerase-like protein (cupin superfamily)/AraC-like DNA-binding protein